MKGKDNIINILRHDPSLAEPWIQDEWRSAMKYGHTYLKGITIEECLRIPQIPTLFSEKNLEDLRPAYNCTCSA